MIYIFNDLLTSSSSSRNVGSGDGCERKDRTGQDTTGVLMCNRGREASLSISRSNEFQ